MTHSPTPTELLALRTANAALLNSPDSFCDMVSTIVFALGSAQLLQSPETAAEWKRERDSLAAQAERVIRAEQRRAELEAVLGTHRKDDQAEIGRLRARVAELEAAQALFLLPWAHQLDAKSLDNFVGDLIRAADGPLLFVVDEIHQTVAQWRELVASRPAEPARPASVEDPHDSPLHHTYRLGHDLPETRNA